MMEEKEESAKEEKQGITELTDILDQDIETIVALRIHAERKVGRHQRVIEKITNALGRPFSVYFIIGFIVLWVGVSAVHSYLGLPFYDIPPFPWLQDIMSMGALLLTVIVLTTQNRQARLSEQRRHLDLQINLLAERKVSKLIEMMDELRHDLPSVRNHFDPEAQVMKEPVDPHTALTALNETLKEATKEYEIEIE
ncbi:MAG: hypothetical protein PVS3B1_37730 [Ktedonobacteraceae bacterium]